MPLSDHEQRLLEQMERALHAEDPKFASALQGADLRALFRRRALLAVIGFVLGIGMLVAGVVISQIALSVGGLRGDAGLRLAGLRELAPHPRPRRDRAGGAPQGAGRGRAGPAGPGAEAADDAAVRGALAAAARRGESLGAAVGPRS